MRQRRIRWQVAGFMIFGLAFYATNAEAQKKGEQLAPMQQTLAALDQCLNGNVNDLRTIHNLSLGLTYGWKTGNLTWNWGIAGNRLMVRSGVPDSQLLDSPPPEYMASLSHSLQLCQAANSQPDDKKNEILTAIRNDMAIKEADCEKFGMGRLMEVSVSTTRSGVTESGWEVLYRWLPIGNVQTTELSSLQLSSPVNLKLVPGDTFQLRAKKVQADGKAVYSQIITVPVTSDLAQEIQVPLQ